MSSLSLQESIATILNPTIPDGTHRVALLDDLPGMATFADELMLFNNGQTQYTIDGYPGTRGNAFVLKNMPHPADGRVTVPFRTTGVLTVPSNRTLKVGDGFADTSLTSIAGSQDELFGTHELDNGAAVTITDSGILMLSLRGSCDDLEPDETRVVSIPYTLEEEGLSANQWAVDSYTDAANAWTYDAVTGTFEKVGVHSFARLRVQNSNIVVGTEYTLAFGITNNPEDKAIEVRWIDATNASVGSFPFPYKGEGTQSKTSVAPAGATGLELWPTTGSHLTALENISLTYDIAAPELTWDVLVTHNELVGPKLAQPDAFTGTGWTHEGNGVYSHAPGTTDPLRVPISIAQGKVVNIPIWAKEGTTGTVNCQLVGDTTESSQEPYDIAFNEKDFYRIAAPANVQFLDILPSTDFDGKVERIFPREYLRPDPAVDVFGLTVTDLPESGKARMTWKWPSKQSFPDDSVFTTIRENELLEQNMDFGFRNDDPDSSVLLRNVSAVGRRSAISLRSGAKRLFIDGADLVGGYTNQGVVGERLLTPADFSGTNWVANDVGGFTHTPGSTEPLEADISATAGMKMSITCIARDPDGAIDGPGIIGTLDVELVGDTTETSVQLVNDNAHREWIVLVPANVTKIRYKPSSDFNATINRADQQMLLVEDDSGGDQKFQAFIATANRSGPQVDTLVGHNIFADGLQYPMPDNYQTTNGDAAALARGSDSKIHFKAKSYWLNCHFKNHPDADVDGKTDFQFNFSYFGPAHRLGRTHSWADGTFLNMVFKQGLDTESAFNFEWPRERMGTENCYLIDENGDFVRITSAEQLHDKIIKTKGLHAGKGALFSGIFNSYTKLGFYVHTQPIHVHPYADVNMTHMRFEYALAGSNNWQDFNWPRTGLPRYSGDAWREFDLAADNYDFRVTCFNGANQGNTVELLNQGIN